MNSETAITPAPLPTITLPSLLSGFSGQQCLCLELDASGAFGGQLVDSALWRPADLFCDPILVPLAISSGQLDSEEAEFLMGVLDSEGVMDLCYNLLSLLRPYSCGRTIINGLPSIQWRPESGPFFDWFLDELAGTLAMRRLDQALRVAGDLNASHAEHLENDLRSRVVSEYLESVRWVTGRELAWSIHAGLGLDWMPILLPVESAYIQARVSPELDAGSRNAITAFLNKHHPGWSFGVGVVARIPSEDFAGAARDSDRPDPGCD